ncbi:type IV pilus modification protein PilV [Methylomonas lenta]|uniref:type IV pilus modification protein PilV n=1 Tax=Methylomonas lenta TaxID=980561 RepID=UPI000834644E|nr:type IV pilus modification protein PilV [Methylomonas lenta]
MNKKSAGFTLIEVLVAVVVLAIGLLGLAGLQASSLRNNQSAYNRSQATQLAYDIADRMRANTIAQANYLTATMAPTAATDQAADCEAVSTTCTPADMAENDLFEWNAALTTLLPSGVGTITIAGGIYTITINWDDNRDGDVDGDGGAPDGDTDADGDTDDDPFFQMSFQL